MGRRAGSLRVETMKSRAEIISEIKKTLVFYRVLGFERLPVKAGMKMGSSERREAREWKKTKDRPGQHPEKRKDSVFVKEKSLRELREEIGDCRRCRLSEGRKNIVFGEGNPDADLMLIGEGPGREEDKQGRPFVGDAGKVLTSLIQKMGMNREEIYIANVVKCRPPMNRDPEADEIQTCSPFLERQIDIIRPKVIMALGRISSQRLVGSKIPISKLRGKFYDVQGIPLMPTFHPAYLIRNPKDKWLTWEDAQKVMEKLK